MSYELTVSKKFFSKYKTISEAVKKALPGTKIYVEAGTYYESIVIDKDIEIIGRGNVIIENRMAFPIKVKTEYAKLSNLTINRIAPVEEGIIYAIELSSTSVEFNNCTITSKVSGLLITGSDTTPTLIDCNFHHIKGSAIDVGNQAKPTLHNCTIHKNEGPGIHFINKGGGYITYCNIYGNNLSNIIISDESDPLIENCKMYESEQNGIWVTSQGKGIIRQCEVYKNTLANIDIDEQSIPLIENCRIYESVSNGVWINAQGKGFIRQCEIFKNVLSNIAISDQSIPTIENCKVYESEQSGILMTSQGKGIIRQCEIFNNTHTNIHIEEKSDPTIENCKVFDGKANGIWVNSQGRGTIRQCEIFKNALPNLAITDHSDPIIENCKVYDGAKSGIYLASQGRGTITRCEIYRNVHPNIIIENQSDPTIENCKVYESTNSGIYLESQGKGTIKQCEIFKNTFSNFTISDQSDPLIEDCKVFESGQSGIWVRAQGRGTFRRCEIYKNIDSNIEINEDGSVTIDKCRVYKSEVHGIILKKNGKAKVINSKIYANDGSNISVVENSNIEIIECEIHDGMNRGVVIESHSTGYMKSSIVKNNAGGDYSISSESKFEIEEDKKTLAAAEDQAITQAPSNQNEPVTDLDKILNELNSLIGLENIKESIRTTIDYIQFNKELADFGIESGEVNIPASHTVLYGGPGTGKTTVAKLYGQLYKAMGLLSSGHVVQVNREKLVGEFIGSTAPKTKAKIDEAQGGVLFIDEAYSLTNKGISNDFGPEAIEVLLEEMENRKGEFIVIVAGYQKEMKNFLEANPGLESRFTEFFHLQDYTPEELLAIARKMVNDQSRMLDPGAEELLLKHFTKLWRKRDRFFSNARLVRNYIEKMFIVQPKRTRNIPKAQWTKEMLLTFTQEDVLEAIPKEKTKSFDLSINEDLLKEAQDQLNRMIGLENVKQEVDRMITLVRFYKEEKRDLTALSTHTVLKGSPGTGKTEVARILAKIYQALGILERGELIEVNRDNLISQNIGGSEKLIANYIEQAKGGTLFIDEAYQLTQYGQSDPGHKVIEVLLKRMEDDRGKFVVMAAGYKEHMEGFLDSNIGLRRRFVQHFDFNDYLPTELLSISTMMAEKTGYYIAASAKEKLLRYYEDSYQNRNETFGNAGFVRNIIEKAIKDLDYRVAKLPKQERNQELIRTITNEDISFYGDQQ